MARVRASVSRSDAELDEIWPTGDRPERHPRPVAAGGSPPPPADERPPLAVVPNQRPSQASAGRRTVTIRGQVAPRPRRSSRRPRERAGARPDRIAMWAVLLGVLLILVAATSSHAAVRSRDAHSTVAHAVVRLAPAPARTRG